MDVTIVVVRVPVAVDLLRVHDGEEVRDGDVPGTSVGAVTAGGAGDQVLAPEDGLDLRHGGLLPLVQGLEVRHKGRVVPHLLQGAHAREDHGNAREARGEANCVAGRTAAVQGIQDRLRVLGQVHEVAALDRLHDEDGLAEFPADLVALPALDRRIVEVRVVELELHGLDVRILRQDLLQQLGAVVEGDAHVADPAFRLEREGRLIGPAGLEVIVVHRALGVHQVEVEVVHATGRQLAREERPDVRLGLEEVRRQLVCQNEAVPGIAAGEAGPQGRLALALGIAMGRIEVVEPGVQEGVHHLRRLGDVHLAVLHGQTHEAEAQILFDAIHCKAPFRFLCLLYAPKGQVSISLFESSDKEIEWKTAAPSGIGRRWQRQKKIQSLQKRRKSEDFRRFWS